MYLHLTKSVEKLAAATSNLSVDFMKLRWAHEIMVVY